jgi:hypothetical protein
MAFEIKAVMFHYAQGGLEQFIMCISAKSSIAYVRYSTHEKMFMFILPHDESQQLISNCNHDAPSLNVLIKLAILYLYY